MRKRWWFVAVLVGVLAVGATGGAILAQNGDGGTNGDSLAKSFAARVAVILGIEEAQVQDAFKQATWELLDERIQRRLDRLVESGRLTQEQADQYLEWYQSRPDAISGGAPLPGLRGLGRHGPRFGHGRHGFGMRMPAPTPDPQTLDATSL